MRLIFASGTAIGMSITISHALYPRFTSALHKHKHNKQTNMFVASSRVYSYGFIGLISSEEVNISAHRRKQKGKSLICSCVCAFIVILGSCLTKILRVLTLISLVKTSVYVLHAYTLDVIVCCRLMPYNQLHDFPPDIFRNSTALTIL